MWNPDNAPRMSFEALAQRVGLARARAIWEAHQERLRVAEAQAAAQEKAWAEERRRKGPIILKDDWIRPAYHISPYTYKAMHRSTLGQRGCTGGEVLDDEESMRDFLKRNPDCAPQKIVSGQIRSGWSAAIDRAAVFGRCERAMRQVQINRQLQSAAAEGRERLIA